MRWLVLSALPSTRGFVPGIDPVDHAEKDSSRRCERLGSGSRQRKARVHIRICVAFDGRLKRDRSLTFGDRLAPPTR